MTTRQHLRRYWWVPLLAIAIIVFFRVTQIAKPKWQASPAVTSDGMSIGQ
jgi:hypothetical protein